MKTIMPIDQARQHPNNAMRLHDAVADDIVSNGRWRYATDEEAAEYERLIAKFRKERQ